MSDFEQKIREDLVAAGIDPDKYLQGTNEFRRPLFEELSQFRVSYTNGGNAVLNLYECPRCHNSRFHWNLRKSGEGWGCVMCFKLRRQWKGRQEWLEEQREGGPNV